MEIKTINIKDLFKKYFNELNIENENIIITESKTDNIIFNEKINLTGIDIDVINTLENNVHIQYELMRDIFKCILNNIEFLINDNKRILIYDIEFCYLIYLLNQCNVYIDLKCFIFERFIISN